MLVIRLKQGLAISRCMERVMQGCDAMIVNLTPFRGPSADIGSAYEMGFMRALGRTIFAYTNDDRPLLDRVAAFFGAVRMRLNGEHEDPGGMAIEPFTLHDNLMLVGGVIASGGCLIAERASHAERYTSLVAFECCVRQAAATVAGRSRPRGRRRKDGLRFAGGAVGSIACPDLRRSGSF